MGWESNRNPLLPKSRRASTAARSACVRRLVAEADRFWGNIEVSAKENRHG